MDHSMHLYGLVMAGGRSSRMGSDKALVLINGQPQYQLAVNRLKTHCLQVYVSSGPLADYKALQIFDLPGTEGKGPAAGLLSAFALHKAAWLVTGVDYPLLETGDIELLIRERDPLAQATVCMNGAGWYEPLIGIYEPAFMERLQTEFAAGNDSLQQILRTSGCKAVRGIPDNHLKSFDTPEDYLQLTSL